MSTKTIGTIELDDEQGEISLRLLEKSDPDLLQNFGQKISPHDMLFVDRDITVPKVIAAWTEQSLAGIIPTVVAVHDGEIVGVAAMHSDKHSWSSHVADIRLLVAECMRGKGLGRHLLWASFHMALDRKIEKVIARMTVDQLGAIAIFEEMGFRAEALLKDHVKDKSGQTHDLAILACDVERATKHLASVMTLV